MKILLFLAMMGLGSYPLLAQDADMFRIKAGEAVEEAIPVVHQYRYENFHNGSVFFYNGSPATARLNYNLLLGEMQFIDISGDTLSLADEHIIEHIRIGENTFYYDPKYGYLEVIAQYPMVKLLVQQSFSTVLKEKKGAYGQSTGTSSIKNYNSYTAANSRLQKLNPNEDVLIAREIAYFLADHNQRIHRAGKSTFMKLFAQQKKTISTYLDEEDINFDKEEDLRQLLQFCSKLNF